MNFYPNYQHVFNRGVEKRKVFCDVKDYERFILGLKEFNNKNSAVELREIIDNPGSRTSGEEDKLVEVVAYCLNPNHYHLLLKEVAENGIAKFIQKLATGYTNYFNKKYERSGVLFQGKYKRVDIKSNPQLLYLSAYINSNYCIHNIEKFGKWKYSSLSEYIKNQKRSFCFKADILGQFNGNREDYLKFCKKNCDDIKEKRKFIKYLLE
jgi:REP element-mobilizing transposase RayT